MTRVPNDPALQVEGVFDTATSTATWRVLDPAARARAIVDPCRTRRAIPQAA